VSPETVRVPKISAQAGPSGGNEPAAYLRNSGESAKFPRLSGAPAEMKSPGSDYRAWGIRSKSCCIRFTTFQRR